MNDKIFTAADFIKKQCGEAEIGLILGSGLDDSVLPENPIKISYKDIPGFPISTTEGHSNEWISGKIHNKKVCIMKGRFHYYEGYSNEDIVMPIRIMKLLGVKILIITNASGAVNESFKPGELMLINDHINFTGFNPLIGKNDERFGIRFPDLSSAYDKELAKTAHECAESVGIKLNDGVYMWFAGPSYETPAEIRMARIMGADAVGMSTVPETITANHCGIRVLGISCLTNMAAGLQNKPLSHEEVLSTGNKVTKLFSQFITDIIKNIH